MNKMTFEHYFESHVWNTSIWDSLVDEGYWSQDFNVEQVFQQILTMAKRDGVQLTDAETVDYDKILYESYKCTEKGLS